MTSIYTLVHKRYPIITYCNRFV